MVSTYARTYGTLRSYAMLATVRESADMTVPTTRRLCNWTGSTIPIADKLGVGLQRSTSPHATALLLFPHLLLLPPCSWGKGLFLFPSFVFTNRRSRRRFLVQLELGRDRICCGPSDSNKFPENGDGI